MWRSLLSVLLCVLVFTAGIGIGVDTAHADQASGSPEQVEVDLPSPDISVWFRVSVQGDGTAVWSIEYRFLLESDEHENAFYNLADDIITGNRDPPLTIDQFDAYRAASEAYTNRAMTLTGGDWSYWTTEDVGVLAFEFEWHNFAQVDGERLHLGDAFRTENGTWLPELPAGYRLTIDAPSDYAVESSPPDKGVDNGMITWDGPLQFVPGEIAVTYVQIDDMTPTPTPTPSPTPTPTATPTDTPLPGTGDGDGSIPYVLLGVIAVLILLGVAYAREWSQSGGDNVESSDSSDGAGPVDPELLSDEERVLRLLEDHGGRMKQAKIVEETGWSNAKVSQLLSEMAEDDQVEKLRLGRENIISLPEESDDA